MANVDCHRFLVTPSLHRRQESASGQVANGVLDFELPFMSKFLLLAAYVAARNKPTLDRRLFDPKAKAARRKGAMAQDRQVRVRLPPVRPPPFLCCSKLKATWTWVCMSAPHGRLLLALKWLPRSRCIGDFWMCNCCSLFGRHLLAVRAAV